MSPDPKILHLMAGDGPEMIARLRDIIQRETVLAADRQLREERMAALEMRRTLSDSVYLELLRKEGRL